MDRRKLRLEKQMVVEAAQDRRRCKANVANSKPEKRWIVQSSGLRLGPEQVPCAERCRLSAWARPCRGLV
jgi:hypothetical protein